MIQIKFQFEADKIRGFSVSGHAAFAPKGNDIVCAGVSAIVIGALNGLKALASNETIFTTKTNLLAVSFTIFSTLNQNLVQMVYYQLKTIAITYPKNISMEEVQ